MRRLGGTITEWLVIVLLCGIAGLVALGALDPYLLSQEVPCNECSNETW